MRRVAGRSVVARIDDVASAELLAQPGVALRIGARDQLRVVDPHEHHGNAGEQLVAVREQERQGLVVGRDDGVEPAAAVLEAQEAFQLSLVGRAAEAAAVHVLDREPDRIRLLLEGLVHTADEVVGPFQPVTVGIQEEDVAGRRPLGVDPGLGTDEGQHQQPPAKDGSPPGAGWHAHVTCRARP